MNMRNQNLFPFICQNADCRTSYDKESFEDTLKRRGLIYAECKEKIFIGFNCEKCDSPIMRAIGKKNSDIDLRKFISIPDPNWNTEVAQQIIERRIHDSKDEYFYFKCNPAWNSKTLNAEDLAVLEMALLSDGNIDSIAFEFATNDADLILHAIPYTLESEEDIIERIKREVNTKEVFLRRIFPAIPRFRFLTACLSHPQIHEIRREGYEALNKYLSQPDNPDVMILQRGNVPPVILLMNTDNDRDIRNSWWQSLLEEVYGQSFKDASLEKFSRRGINAFDEKEFEKILNSILLDLHGDETVKLRRLVMRIGFEKIIWKHLKDLYQDVLYKLITELSLVESRLVLRDWFSHVAEGKALLVNAPMGLGKTHSIAQVLAERKDMSAVIFMPTLKMCEEVVEQIKTNIAKSRGVFRRDRIDEEKTEEAKDNDGSFMMGDDGFPLIKWKREYLEDEVYFVDGINEHECVYYHKIIKAYREDKGWKKRNFCKRCKKRVESACRFLNHEENARKARIVVTTHAQYDKFYAKTELQRWDRKTEPKDSDKRQSEKRTVFVVDEDLVISNCYQPKGVDPDILKEFISDFISYVAEVHDEPEAVKKLYEFLGKITQCESEAIIAPIDRNFDLPKEVLV